MKRIMHRIKGTKNRRKEYILNDQGVPMSYEDFWEYYKKKIEEKYQKGQISNYKKAILLTTKQLELSERR